MIRLDGYYVFKPILFQERKEWEPWYSIQAYLFQENNIVVTTQRWTKDKNNTSFFNIKDFKEGDNTYNYILKGNELCLIREATTKWVSKLYFDKISDQDFRHKETGEIIKIIPKEEKFYYDRISNEEFVSRQTGDIIKFVPWSSNTTNEEE